MTDTKFTKGPWAANIIKDDCGFHGFRINNESSNCNLICEFVRGGRWQYILCDDKEEEANAHLIAAAPDMYDMLESIAKATVHDKSYAAAKPIFDLLKKARGE